MLCSESSEDTFVPSSPWEGEQAEAVLKGSGGSAILRAFGDGSAWEEEEEAASVEGDESELEA